MALQISTQITINATPEAVWSVLTDFKSYPEWNDFIRSIQGDVQVNKTIKVLIDGMKFSPKVLRYDTNEHFEWLGNFLFRGIFDGKHSFQLIQNEDATTTFIHSEAFRGVLLPFLTKKLKTEILPKFQRMNEKLKERVENQTASRSE